MRERGHDVLAAEADPETRGLEDADLLSLAALEGRILVTFDAKDFMPLIKEWASESRHHAGCILLPSSFRHEQFGRIIAGIEQALADAPEQDDWVDRAIWVSVR